MPNEGFLADEDVRRLTGFARASGQESWLKTAGIPFKRRGPVVLVLWTHVEQWIEGKPLRVSTGPNFSAINSRVSKAPQTGSSR